MNNIIFNRARTNLNEHIKRVDTWNEFCSELNKKNMLLSPFCGELSCEDNIKADSARYEYTKKIIFLYKFLCNVKCMYLYIFLYIYREDTGEEPGALSMGAKSLCIPFEQPTSPTPLNKQKCIHLNCQNEPKFYTLFGRSY